MKKLTLSMDSQAVCQAIKKVYEPDNFKIIESVSDGICDDWNIASITAIIRASQVWL